MSYAQAGRTTETRELTRDAAYLRQAWKALDLKDHDFAQSLLASYDSERGVSDKQAQWISTLAQRAEAKTTTPKALAKIDLSKINEMFAEARKLLKHPHILLDGEACGTLRVSEAGPSSRYYGELMVTTNGGYENRIWLGRINQQGVYIPSLNAQRFEQGDATLNVHKALQFMATDPVGTAKAYGQRFGVCCFCSRTLTDERSVTAGYGPVCAEHYGLSWGECEAVENDPRYVDGESEGQYLDRTTVRPSELTDAKLLAELLAPVPGADEVDLNRLALLQMVVHPAFYDFVVAQMREGKTFDEIAGKFHEAAKVCDEV